MQSKINCPQCSKAATLSCVEFEDSSLHAAFYCSACSQVVSNDGKPWLSIDDIGVLGYESLQDLPFASIQAGIKCRKCGNTGVQLHHWFPQSYDKAGHWSHVADYLCVSCHLEWHDKLTPGLVKHS